MDASVLLIQLKSAVLSISESTNGNELFIGLMGNEIASESTLLRLFLKENEVLKYTNFNTYKPVVSSDVLGRSYLFFSTPVSLKKVDLKSEEVETVSFEEGISKVIVSQNNDALITSGKTLKISSLKDYKQKWILSSYKGGLISKEIDLKDFDFDFEYNPFLDEKINYINQPACVEYSSGKRMIFYGGVNSTVMSSVSLDSLAESEISISLPLQIRYLALGVSETVLVICSKIPTGTYVWNLENYSRVLPDIFNKDYESCSAVCVHPTRRIIAFGTSIGFVYIHDIDDEGDFVYFDQPHRGSVNALCFSADGEKLYSGADDGKLILYNI